MARYGKVLKVLGKIKKSYRKYEKLWEGMGNYR